MLVISGTPVGFAYIIVALDPFLTKNIISKYAEIYFDKRNPYLGIFSVKHPFSPDLFQIQYLDFAMSTFSYDENFDLMFK